MPPRLKTRLSPPERAQTDSTLTIVIPTRNRARHCHALLRFLGDMSCRHPIIVADSSDHDEASAVQVACEGFAEYRQFAPDIRLRDKLEEVGKSVATRYVLPTPDDDIVLPHAIDAALYHLDGSPDFVVASGYVLNYGIQQIDFDIHRVSWFTPTIGEPAPLQRLYHLIRRYQPFIWGVMRTDALVAALGVIRPVESVLFGEIGRMSILALQGGIMRLPVVFQLRGMEKSQTNISQSHPFHWFLGDAQSFFQSYAFYRETLERYIRDSGIAGPKGADLTQLLDLVHATWLGREIDLGMTKHAATLLLGDTAPPPVPPQEDYRWRDPDTQDIVHFSADRTRRYIWRHAVLEAEPREEIRIDADEIARVEQQLDSFRTE